MTEAAEVGIPLVDLAESSTLSRKVETACRDVGFMYVGGHGISPETLQGARTAVIEYFSLPLAEKMRHRISRDNYRGYIPAGFFSPNTGSKAADNYEGFKLHFEVDAGDPACAACDLYGPNKWPGRPLNFRERLLAYWRECDRVAAVLMRAMAQVLGISGDELLEKFETPLTNMTLLHYPPQAADSSGFGIHPHKDTDVLTILAPDPVGGLQVRPRNGNGWLHATPVGDALIVNIGDLMELWSGGYFVSTPHKVVNTSGSERYSFPYFAVPRFDTVVAPLCSPVRGFDRAGVHVGDVSREVWRTNWPDAVADKPQFDLGTLEN